MYFIVCQLQGHQLLHMEIFDRAMGGLNSGAIHIIARCSDFVSL